MTYQDGTIPEGEDHNICWSQHDFYYHYNKNVTQNAYKQNRNECVNIAY